MQALASIVLVLITAVYTVLTRAMAKAAREVTRPYVYLDLAIANTFQMIVAIRNSGSRKASTVSIVLRQASNAALAASFRDLRLDAGIGDLPPGGERRYGVLFKLDEVLPRDQPATVLHFEIHYRSGSRRMSETQRIDFAGYQKSLFDRDGDQLAKIGTTLDRIAEKMPERVIRMGFGSYCPYCGTGLPKSATKCHGCLEWLPPSGSSRARRSNAGRRTVSNHARPARARSAAVHRKRQV
jgi:hypothetical protein